MNQPLWALKYLLGEEWLTDTIVEAALHQASHRINHHLSGSGSRHRVLFANTNYGCTLKEPELNRSYQNYPLAIAKQIQECNPRFLAFVYNKGGNHWAPCVIDLDCRRIYEGDSLGCKPMVNLCDRLSNVLGSCGNQDLAWTLHKMDVVPQVNNYDCSVVAVNAIEHFLDSTTPLWSLSQSIHYRQVWFYERVHEHVQQSCKIHAICSSYFLVTCLVLTIDDAIDAQSCKEPRTIDQACSEPASAGGFFIINLAICASMCRNSSSNLTSISLRALSVSTLPTVNTTSRTPPLTPRSKHYITA